jgi:hypothetical protein
VTLLSLSMSRAPTDRKGQKKWCKGLTYIENKGKISGRYKREKGGT